MTAFAAVHQRARAAVAHVEQRVSLQVAIATLLFAVLALGVVALQTYHFADRRNYRDDEIRTVHAGMTMSPSEVVQWMSIDIHPPLWRVSATIWVSLFGPDEAVTRFQSSLYALVALALAYRLMSDLFGRQVALVATFLLGTHALFVFYTHELRPYGALLMWVLAVHLFLLRWLRRPGFLYGALYVLSCAGALYTHFFALYAIAGQVLAFLLLVRWNPGLYLRALGLWIAAGLSFIGWLPSFLHSYLISQPGGIGYGIPLDDPGSPGLLYDTLQIRPYAIGTLLTLTGLVLPARLRRSTDARFRTPQWRKWYFVVGAVVSFALVILTDLTVVSVLTQRNLILLLPAITLLAALGLRALPWQVTLLALPLILNPAARDFVDFQRNQPYREVLAFVEESYVDHDPVIISVDRATRSAYFTYAYTLMDWMPGRIDQTDMFYLAVGVPDINLPEPPLNHITDAGDTSLDRFRALTADAGQVFWIWSSEEAPYVQTYRDVLLEAGFSVARSARYHHSGSTYVVEAYTPAE